MSTASFEQYEAELFSTTEQIKSRIQSKKEGKEGTSTVDDLVKQGENLMKQMGLEAREMDDAVAKRDLLVKVR